MPRLRIDNQSVDVPAGATVLEAARKLGIDIPALCYLEGCRANTSCMACLVKLEPGGRLVPSCATRAQEGMAVQSETPIVHEARRAALELLLSDHGGDCLAPCQRVCPAHMDIPRMIRQIAAGEVDQAIRTVKATIALPAVLGRICPAPCEKGCRRRGADAAVSVCLLKRHAADADLAGGEPYVPVCAPASGKRVAIVGAGPAGLSAAYYLAVLGHAVTVLDEHEEPGGNLRYAVPQSELPRQVLNAEIGVIRRLGVTFRMGTRLGRDVELAELRRQFDAVLMATGSQIRCPEFRVPSPVSEDHRSEALGHEARDPRNTGPPEHGTSVAPHTFATSDPGLFAAGAAVRPGRLAIRSAAEGRAAAISIHQYLWGQRIVGPERPFTVTLPQLDPVELAQFLAGAGGDVRQEPVDLGAGLEVEQARREASRCLHCDCRKAGDCKLRFYAQRYGADPHRYDAPRRPVVIQRAGGGVLYEPHKCIGCGLCVQIAAAWREPLGLTFIGRGFDVRPGVPLGASLAEGLTQAAAACVRACPTGALAWDQEGPGSSSAEAGLDRRDPSARVVLPPVQRPEP